MTSNFKARGHYLFTDCRKRFFHFQRLISSFPSLLLTFGNRFSGFQKCEQWWDSAWRWLLLTHQLSLVHINSTELHGYGEGLPYPTEATFAQFRKRRFVCPPQSHESAWLAGQAAPRLGFCSHLSWLSLFIIYCSAIRWGSEWRHTGPVNQNLFKIYLPFQRTVF